MNNLACLSKLLDKQNINGEKVSYFLNGLFHNLEFFCRLQGFYLEECIELALKERNDTNVF